MATSTDTRRARIPALARRLLARRLLARLLLALLLLTPASPAAADSWYEHYARARDAMAEERWTDAVGELNEALARRGDSGARVRTYGMRVTAYFPYLEIGIAYYHLEQYQAALEAFETEERLGAIQESPAELERLRTFRRQATEARAALAAEEQRRIRRIVADSLERSRAAEATGDLDAAITALAPALAVDPDNASATAAIERLRTGLARLTQQAAETRRASELLTEGRALLSVGRFSEASTRLRQAQALRPTPELDELLEQARQGLLAAIEADLGPSPEGAGTTGPSTAGARRDRLVESGLARARRLEQEGRLEKALGELQPVLAMVPDQAEARTLQRRLLAAQEAAARAAELRDVLAEAAQALEQSRYEPALSAANRALALDRQSQEALSLIQRAYAGLSRRLLGASTGGNLPPAIRFVDLRQDLADGTRAQVVRRPELVLNGIAIDATPVSLAFKADGRACAPAQVSSQEVGGTVLTELTLRLELQPGPTSIEVRATDAEGLSSTSQYLVVYERPPWRAWWLWAGLALLATAAAAVLLIARRRRKLHALRRRFNPYVAGAPVLDQALFYGREQLVNHILQVIHCNSLLLYGERRIGKTSLQHHLRRRLRQLEDPEYRFFPAYVDLQGTPEERFFATIAEDVFSELEPWLDGLLPGEDLLDGRPYGYRELVRDLRAILSRLGHHTSRKVRLVLLIDEVDELNAYDPRTSQKLRSLFMKSFAESLVAVVSGVSIRREWDREGSPWYNFFEEIEVDAISPEAARRLVLEPVRGIFELDEDVVRSILERSGCKPYLIQRLCVALINHLHEQGRTVARQADLEAVAATLRS